MKINLEVFEKTRLQEEKSKYKVLLFTIDTSELMIRGGNIASFEILDGIEQEAEGDIYYECSLKDLELMAKSLISQIEMINRDFKKPIEERNLRGMDY